MHAEEKDRRCGAALYAHVTCSTWFPDVPPEEPGRATWNRERKSYSLQHAPLPVPSPTAPLHIRVLLFSVLREEVGQAMLKVMLNPPATGADLLDDLAAAHPVVAAYRPALRLAVNEAYAPEHTALADGDEVALITPVSGG